jgi:hypothetical protein
VAARLEMRAPVSKSLLPTWLGDGRRAIASHRARHNSQKTCAWLSRELDPLQQIGQLLS